MGAFSELNMEESYSEPEFSPFIGASFTENPQDEQESNASLPSPAAESVMADEKGSASDSDAEPTPEDDGDESCCGSEDPEDSEGEEPEEAKPEDSEDAKRKAHEEAEAKRKAEWEAKYAERHAVAQAERDRVAALPDDAVMVEAMKRVSKGFEQLTRRSMKDMVSEYVQTVCLSDPAFSRRAMDPKKSMINCVKYINNKAREYLKQEMENNDMKPENGIYGGDVPDDVVYQWAVDYFNDPNAKEDEVKEEKFVPKPYNGRSAAAKSKAKKEKPAKKAEKKSAEKKVEKQTAKKPVEDAQCSLLDLFGATEGSAA